MLKVGNRVNVRDKSYSFGIQNGDYSPRLDSMENLLIVHVDLDTIRHTGEDKKYCGVNDLLVTDGRSGFWFTQSRFCRLIDKEIEIRYFSDGKDVTNRISDETKRNLKAL